MEPGDTFGRYELRGLIGHGAMAEVFEAYDPLTDRSIALKILKPDQRRDQGLVRRFLDEARAAGALSHPHIVAYYDVGIEREVPYITMEFMRGPTLAALLADRGRLELKASIQILQQIADALDYAHRAGRVHRDVKPTNILLTPDLRAAKLTDFGVARVERTDATAATHVGEIIGTPRYMSPEQLDGAKVDGRTDLFCLGVVGYEMLTGAKAFDAESLPALITQITRNEPRAINQLAPDIPPALAAAVHKLMAKRPDDRWQSGGEFAVSLSNAADQREAKERRRNLNPDDWNGSRRWWPLLLLGGGGIVVAVAIAMLFWPVPPGEPPGRPGRQDRVVVDHGGPREPPASEAGPSLPPIDSHTQIAREPDQPSPAWPPSWQNSWLSVAANVAPGTCLWLEQTADNGLPSITGIAASDELRRDVLASLQDGALADSVDIELDDASSRVCRLVEAIAGKALPAPQRIVDLEPGIYQLVEGEKFRIMIAAPDTDSYMTVHYFDASGSVHHLFPSDHQIARLVRRGERFAVAALADNELWEVSPPFGREAILLLAASKELFGPAPGESEPADAFVDRLSSALGSFDGPSLPLASLLVLETSAR